MSKICQHVLHAYALTLTLVDCFLLKMETKSVSIATCATVVVFLLAMVVMGLDID